MHDRAMPFRLNQGGVIDRSRAIRFSIDGEALQGFAGDTLASALLANGRRVVARSRKYHRPRGIMTCGSEEPNALLQIASGNQSVPNTRATEVCLSEGLEVFSQNCWPGVETDIGSLLGALSALMPAGFYYKTFMWPRRAWTAYERVIRRAAGLGRAPRGIDPDRYAKRYAHCDVLVVGGGPAGIAAALAAARSGARVLLCDNQSSLGGALTRGELIEGVDAPDWAASARRKLAASPFVETLERTHVFGLHDHNLALAIEHLEGVKGPRMRLWKIRAKQIVLATGAIERPLVFPDNDRPGIMLACAVGTYIERYAVRPGSRAVVFTNNDSGYNLLHDLRAADIDIAAAVDMRAALDPRPLAEVTRHDCPLHTGSGIVATHGGKRLRGVAIAAIDPAGAPLAKAAPVECDLLCMAGGWSPTLQLYAQARGRLRFDRDIRAFLPGGIDHGVHVAGSAAGSFGLEQCLHSGHECGERASATAGFEAHATHRPSAANSSRFLCGVLPPTVAIDNPRGKHAKQFVDFQTDTTVADLHLAIREGFADVEHAKRYTTSGMGTDQGKTGNLNAIAVIAQATGVAEQDIGQPTMRPPYVPVTFGAIAGEDIGVKLVPTRRSPLHERHAASGAVFMTSGAWLYPRYYPRNGESMRDCVAREVHNVHENVGVTDMSTLGKIDVQGPDALEFLERVYCNDLSGIALGRARYSVMLREDGIVLDDGTVTRLARHHFLVTTTTANAWRVWLHLEKLRQVHWPALDVKLASVTDHWASLAIAGPGARDLLSLLDSGLSLDNGSFPFMSVKQGSIMGVEARVFRISYSGELGFEVNVPAGFAPALWRAILDKGGPYNIAPYGLEALDVMRIEKGFLAAGTEIDGRATPGDLGLSRMVSNKKDFVGRCLLQRAALHDPDRRQLTGLVPVDGVSPVPEGAQVTLSRARRAPQPSIGHVTAATRGARTDKPIALAMIQRGRERRGERLWANSPVHDRFVQVEICDPVFFDPKGVRLRG